MTAPTPDPAPMPDPDGPGGPAAERSADRLVLPDQTRDDLDLGWGERTRDPSDDDERYLRERPPHWE